MDIKSAIDGWDGKSAADIGGIYDRFAGDDSFVAQLAELMVMRASEKGATWLLKRHLETGSSIDASDADEVFARMEKLDHWESKLHLLQCLPFLPISKDNLKKLTPFLRNCLGEENKFVRAWAYGGFCEAARQHPEQGPEAERLIEIAMRDEAPSVKARIRRMRI